MQQKVGSIVTIIDRNDNLYDKQGVVISFQYQFWGPPEVLVRFNERDIPPYLRGLPWEEDEDDFVYAYQPRELQCEPDWRPNVYAERFFRNHWHTVYWQTQSLDKTKSCQVADCSQKQSQQIWFNVWGSVSSAYVCPEHAREYHGHMMDMFPWRKDKAA